MDEVAVAVGAVFPVQGLPVVGVFLPAIVNKAGRTERLVAVMPGRNVNKARRREPATVNKAGRTEPKAGRKPGPEEPKAGKTCRATGSKR